ncbi:MAG: arginine--tRNA ligase [Chitinivibrionales bacterium]|nr:arginine--tRNA ligase [Chitinivibrionales bacterium]MBD3394535.1 arginine--tRNA ligase [Chitinivibrionales bacterium]
MASFQAILTDIFGAAFAHCGFERRFGQVVISQRPDLCQFQCNGALAVSKAARQNPREIAARVVDTVGSREELSHMSIAGPGFININLAPSFLAAHLRDVARDPRCGTPAGVIPGKVVIDYGGPNVAKPMHVGHLRNAIIGQCFSNLFGFLGSPVVSDNHLGDWGTQMGMLICALAEMHPELPYFDAGSRGPYPGQPPVSIEELEAIYPEANRRCKADPEAMARAQKATVELQNGRPGYVALWKYFVDVSVERLKADFEKLGVAFDRWLGESFYQKRMEDLVARLKKQGLAKESEGALVLPVSRDGDTREIPPLMLMKSDGAFLYGTSDLATLEFRMQEFNPSEIIYVVDIRQSLHFEQVFRAARRAGIVPESVRLEHAGFGTVNGPDGRPFKTREGDVMQLGDLLDMVYARAYERMVEAGVAQDRPEDEKRDIARKVGLAALRFADLQNHRTSDYVFDIEKFLQFEGKTGPYLLYSAVRIKSILRNAAEKRLSPGEIAAPQSDAEQNLMLALGHLPASVRTAADTLAPNVLCDWAYGLAQQFNRFYRDCHVLREKDARRQGSWLALIRLALDELTLALGLLGMEIPDRM